MAERLRETIRYVSGMNRTSFTTKGITVSSAGTAVQGPNVEIPDGYSVVIKARDANTGDIKVAESQAKAQSATRDDYFVIKAGQAISLAIDNLNRVWVNSTVNGEGVDCIVEQ